MVSLSNQAVEPARRTSSKFGFFVYFYVEKKEPAL